MTSSNKIAYLFKTEGNGFLVSVDLPVELGLGLSAGNTLREVAKIPLKRMSGDAIPSKENPAWRAPFELACFYAVLHWYPALREGDSLSNPDSRVALESFRTHPTI